MHKLPSVLWHCWLGGRKGIWPVKKYEGWRRWALVSPDGVAPSRMVSVPASVNLPLHHKVQKFSSGTSSHGVVTEKGLQNGCVCVCVCVCMCNKPTVHTTKLTRKWPHLQNMWFTENKDTNMLADPCWIDKWTLFFSEPSSNTKNNNSLYFVHKCLPVPVFSKFTQNLILSLYSTMS